MNADDTQYIITEILSGNLYTYCANNPIMYADYNGKFMDPIHTGPIIDLERNTEFIMTATMYALALVNKNPFAYYDFSWNQIFIEKIEKSEIYRNFLWKVFTEKNLQAILTHMVHEHRDYLFIGSGSLDFNYATDKDLQYSIGNSHISINIYKVSSYISEYNGYRVRDYEIIIKISDKYDFEYEEKWGGIKDAINNILGYLPQQTAQLIPYAWHIDIIYPYSFICRHGY